MRRLINKWFIVNPGLWISCILETSCSGIRNISKGTNFVRSLVDRYSAIYNETCDSQVVTLSPAGLIFETKKMPQKDLSLYF